MGGVCRTHPTRRLKMQPGIRFRLKQGNLLIDADFEGAKSGVTALYGPSGAGKTFVDVHLDIGCPLWARITRQSCGELNPLPGLPVFALIKNVAVSLGASNIPCP
jgi:ABC-type molybdate transport system ATPase subunit